MVTPLVSQTDQTTKQGHLKERPDDGRISDPVPYGQGCPERSHDPRQQKTNVLLVSSRLFDANT